MFDSYTEEDLIALGRKIGEKLTAGQVLVLTGDLGAGKTTLTKGIGQGLGVTQMIKSPTYTIVREYEGRLPLYHLDVYRIGDDPDSIDLDEFLFGSGVTVIEWGQLLGQQFTNDYVEVVIERLEEGRRVSFKAHGPSAQSLVKELTNG
ncbi:tRNA (adenosine(37)-N6)-threonylcarbamoyltransferase complex ATPase subunit type 1 TsaE [Streptococcus cuniculipharyngis]|uniref:tRNA threonylcarbamoyladenosine biosynthesis protein TsaE n=1 Tax=Streptococcus cuniculipharyngis TaxID=1562651 RepID=A0A5C5SAJ5_9STRE|nr:tRNA (adenosine(37)-N6)-threonylcarbamoyltransferase complex ATPase subunit type 1 TsaE [Streptococcus cuniculipharyngis]TWS96691.1 tRNA (adenosine(37)-N6)-threonylcarbamoyltransferase complex ATPase subunit type 1 TsaE [Streptococcus cuniculipharyngis]